MTTLLTKVHLDEAMKSIPQWTLAGKEIRRTFEHKDFVSALGFVMSAGILAERADHHPDIDIRWNKVTLTLSTHSAGGLTTKDIELARAIDAL